MIALPILLLGFPARTPRTRDLFLVLGFYAVSHVFELTDRPVFALTHGLVSGHTLKHACAVVASIWLLRAMIGRGKGIEVSVTAMGGRPRQQVANSS